jgi:uncharacterized tellurite resistance protein B-like protein
MAPNETEACLRILFAVAVADGDVSADEERALAILAGYDGSPESLPGVLDIAAEAARITSLEARRATLDAAVAIAEVDGRCTREEHAVLERLRNALGVDETVPLEAVEGAWHEQLLEPRERLAAAEVKFLHTLAAKRDAMSTADYAALVEDLRAERARILREAIGPRAPH